jgi:pyridoxine 5-phosphate synthase
MTRLSVNIDYVATLRQVRRAQDPDPVHAALAAELAGAHGITVHLRSDRRQIQDRDVEILRRVVKSRLTVEMAPTQEMMRVALTIKPDQVTLVPERREEVTTEGGLDAVLNSVQLRPHVKTLRDGGVHVSLFIDPDLEQVKEARRIGVPAIEINTAAYADATTSSAREEVIRRAMDAAKLGHKLGLDVHGGQGLNYRNVATVAAISEISELNIGHAIVARAVLVGFERAVREMIDAMRQR